MTCTVDPRSDASIGTLPDWQQVICQEVRRLVHAADPEVEGIIANNRAGGWRKLKTAGAPE